MENAITEDELSLADSDMADKLRAILAAKYGLIALEEPVLHVAVANAAALNYLAGELRAQQIKQLDDVFAAHQAFRDSLNDTLMYFEKNLVATVKRAVSETCEAHIGQFRLISEKQTAQLQYTIDALQASSPAAGSVAVSAVAGERPASSSPPGVNWRHIGFAALGGAFVALLAVLLVL